MSWQQDLGYIRFVGPDTPPFNKAVKRVWKKIEQLEKELRDHQPKGTA